jgi:hypothetical protein
MSETPDQAAEGEIPGASEEPAAPETPGPAGAPAAPGEPVAEDPDDTETATTADEVTSDNAAGEEDDVDAAIGEDVELDQGDLEEGETPLLVAGVCGCTLVYRGDDLQTVHLNRCDIAKDEDRKRGKAHLSSLMNAANLERDRELHRRSIGLWVAQGLSSSPHFWIPTGPSEHRLALSESEGPD